MYILGKEMVGNIVESKSLQMKKNKMVYSNDCKNYRECEIPNSDLFEGNINEFYTYATVYKDAEEDLYKKLKPFLHEDKLYFRIRIDNENNLVDKDVVLYDKCLDDKVVMPQERVIPKPVNLKNNEISYYGGKCEVEGLSFGIVDRKPSREVEWLYVSSVMLPSMKYHEKAKMYTFDNIQVLSYKRTGC